MQSTGEAEGIIKERSGVSNDISEGIVLDSFYHIAGSIGNDAEGTDGIIGEVVSLTASVGHGIRHPSIGIFEPVPQVVTAVEDRQKRCPAGPEVFFGDDTVDLPGDPTAQWIVDVFDHPAVGQVDPEQFATGGIAVAGDGIALGFPGQKAVEIVIISGVSGGIEVILHRIGEASAGDVPQGVHFILTGSGGVIPVFFDENAVPGDGQQPTERIIGVAEDRGDAGGGFGSFLYPAVGIPGGDLPVEKIPETGLIHFAVRFGIAVEGPGQRKTGIRHRFRQAVGRIPSDGEPAGAGEKPVIVIAVNFGVSGVGEAVDIEIVVVGIPDRLVQGAGEGFFGEQAGKSGIKM